MSHAKLNYATRLASILRAHPELKDNNIFSSFARKQQNEFSAYDVQNLTGFLAHLLIEPEYTYSVVRAFRPLLPLIVSHLVENRSYDASSFSQEIHDKKTVALSKLLPLYPHFLRFLLKHLENSPPLLDRVLTQSEKYENATETEREKWRELVKTAFRILHYAPEEFSRRWNWSPFYVLLQHSDQQVRWFSARCISLLTKFGEKEHENWISSAANISEVEKMDMEMQETEQDSLEKRIAFVDTEFGDEVDDDTAMQDSEVNNNISSAATYNEHNSMVNVCGIWLPKKNIALKQSVEEQRKSDLFASADDQQPSNRLIYTPTTIENMRAIALCVSQCKPVLLEGVTGGGKTALIEELARLTGNVDLIKINLDDSFDSKDMLGTYVCTDVPGEFKWQPGALTKAIIEGRWILIEDIDLAPFDVLSVLIPILESNTLFLASRDEVIPAAHGFQLFATQSMIETFSGVPRRQRVLPIANLWTRVVIDTLPAEEIKTILEERYPPLKPHIPKFIRTFDALRGCGHAINNSETESGSQEENKDLAQLKHFGRYFSFRDLLKWCNRVCTLSQDRIRGSFIVSHLKDDIFSEAVDCFCGAIPTNRKDNSYKLVIDIIARVWDVSPDQVQHYVANYKPIIEPNMGSIKIGRITLPTNDAKKPSHQQRFAHTKQSLRLLERIAVCTRMCEPVLLTGETGTGKTSIVQYLANMLGRKLLVHNLNQQTDSSDFIGGYKPVELRILAFSIKSDFEKLFTKIFSRKSNQKFLDQLQDAFEKKQWRKLVSMCRNATQKIKDRLLNNDAAEAEVDDRPASSPADMPPNKQRRLAKGQKSSEKLSAEKRQQYLQRWAAFEDALARFERQQVLVRDSFAFSFVEGSLVKALKEGHWILLDEINLASTETLERLSSLLEGEEGTIFITEKGDTEPIKRHENFRLFACMNPPTDVGKKDLPPALRNRFTEFYVEELTDREDLITVVSEYVNGIASNPPIHGIVDFYLTARRESVVNLSDGAGQRPHYSLRTLSRALEYTRLVLPIYGFVRALYEGFSMSFLTQLNAASANMMEPLIRKYLCNNMTPKELSQPVMKPGDNYEQFEHFWLETGNFQGNSDLSKFILTPTVSGHLKNLARVVLAKKYPVLLQGPTSAGKTSMIEYLAKKTKHRFVRINNHESTDLQEYLGTYITDPDGKLVFKEGILVEAVRNGYWIVLDELNLAPSDVLEALNRLLDDNRELFIPETQEVIKPHPHFHLFATQNPPGLYGGRKALSRAFRNRFLELHVDDIPGAELITILEKRCQIPKSFAEKLVAIMDDLQRQRQGSKVFAGKHGFITPRDLFRWAERKPSTYKELAEEGYMLLAERLRRDDEKLVVKNTIEKYMKGEKIDIDKLYDCESTEEFRVFQDLIKQDVPHAAEFRDIVWTHSMKRLFTLVGRCIKNKEPVLLVGETGCGKTTICQIYSFLMKAHLHILNCHQHTETSDFLGGLRPVRGRDILEAKIKRMIEEFLTLGGQIEKLEGHKDASVTQYLQVFENESEKIIAGLIDEINSMHIDGNASTAPAVPVETTTHTIDNNANLSKKKQKQLKKQQRQQEKQQLQHQTQQQQATITPSRSQSVGEKLRALEKEIKQAHRELKSLFVWYDGPLVQAMKQGDFFLVDEISLAEDAVLERLNSVLEPIRLLVLAEKGSDEIEELIAHHSFRIMATMNPGGDFGKKELSPALRNRFTEIYVPSLSVSQDLQKIVEIQLASRMSNIPQFSASVTEYSKKLVAFIDYFRNTHKSKRALSIRDIMSWIQFINIAVCELGLQPEEAFMHGADVVILGGLGIGTGMSEAISKMIKRECLEFLIGLFSSQPEVKQRLSAKFMKDSIAYGDDQADIFNHQGNSGKFGVHPFYIAKGQHPIPPALQYTMKAPTTGKNVYKILRAMQLRKPLLLEGSPGVGKTSIIQSLAIASGHKVVRINLSEQTDMMDLLGTDLPSEGSQGGEFKWADGIFLRALKDGDWVLLDELNLASQSVLEGLNSVLDHRGEIFIPELNRTFTCHKDFRIFACQNPLQQGGGRKGLPKSFLNRFTQVHVGELKSRDLLFIAHTIHPELGEANLRKMIEFNKLLHHETMVECKFGRKGSPWEFNLRDVFRWCELIKSSTNSGEGYDPALYVDCVYRQRLRTENDRKHLAQLFKKVFGRPMHVNVHPYYNITPEYVQVGNTKLQRKGRLDSSSEPNNKNQNLALLHSFLNPLENILKCVEMNYMVIVNGPASSGKTSLVRLVANLTGNTLNEFSMNSSVDTVELLGGFEQIDPLQKTSRLVRKSKQVLDKLAAGVALATDNHSRASMERIKQLYNSWATFASSSGQKLASSPEVCDSQSKQFFDADRKVLEQLLIQIQQLALELASPLGHEIATFVQQLLQQLHELTALAVEGVKGRFEWTDGMLIRALESGDWVMIDNVNFCNPTVLDRLNPLLEPGGVLVVNERGAMSNGEIKVIKPHPNFRLFLVMDPSNGEISRAMRNRGVEIALNPIPIPSQDAITILASVGLTSIAASHLLMKFHQEYVRLFGPHLSEEDKPTLRDLIRCGELIACELRNNNTPELVASASLTKAFRLAVESVYIRNRCFIKDQRDMVKQLLDHVVGANDESSTVEEVDVFPNSYLLSNAFRVSSSHNVTLRNMLRQGGYLYHTVLRLLLIPTNTAELSTASLRNTVTTDAVRNSLPSNLLSVWAGLVSQLPSQVVTEADKPTQDQLYDLLFKSLLFAAEYFIDMASIADLEYRKMFLERLVKVVQSHQDRTHNSNKEKLRAVLDKIMYVFKHRFELPVVKAIADQNHYEPLDLRVNTAAFRAMSSEQRQQSLQLFEKLRILSAQLQRTFDEGRLYEKYAMDRSMFVDSEMSLLEKSHWCWMNPQDRARLSNNNDVIAYFYPFIKAIDDFAKAVLHPATLIEDTSLLLTLEKALKTRNQLWIHLSTNTKLHPEFLIYWDWCCKAVSVLNASSSAITSLPQCQHLLSVMNEMAPQVNKAFDNVANGGKKNYLWKVGGHPMVMNFPEIRAIKEELERTVAELYDTAGTDGTEIDYEVKQMAVKGVATLRCTDEEKKYSTDLQASLSQLPTTLKNRANSIQADRQKQSNKDTDEQKLEQVFLSLSKPSETDDSDEPMLKRKVKDFSVYSPKALLPLFDHKSMVQELEVISILTELNYRCRELLAKTGNAHTPVDLTIVVRKIKNLYDTVLTKSCRTPLDMVPYQMLLWRFAQQDSHSSVVAKIEDIVSFLPRYLQEIWLGWNSRTWSSSFNQMQTTISLSDSDHQQQRDMSFEGPPRVFQDVKMSRIIQLLIEAKSVPIKAKHTKSDQLAHIVSFLSEQQQQQQQLIDAGSSDWKTFVYLLANTLVSFEKTFSAEEFQTLLALIERLSTLVLNGNEDHSLANKFKALLIKSSDPRLRAVVQDGTVVSIIEELQNRRPNAGGYEDEIVRGRLWLLLGVCRLMLIIPAQPLDPVLKYSTELQHVQAALSHIQHKLAVFVQIEKFISGGDSNFHIESMREHIENDLEAAAKRLEKKVVPRPSDDLSTGVGNFQRLYTDMKQFVSSLVESNKITSMASALVQPGSDFNSSLLTEELWQGNAANFCRKLAPAYPGYEDITVPFVVCVYQIKHGLRLLCHGASLAKSRSSMNSSDVAFDSDLHKLLNYFFSYPLAADPRAIITQIELMERIILDQERQQKQQLLFGELINSRLDLLLTVCRALLSHIHTTILSSKTANSELLRALDMIYTCYVRLWNMLQDEELRFKQEEEQMYKYKQQEQEIETEEQLEQQDMEEMFPSFTSHFADLDDELRQELQQQPAPSAEQEKKKRRREMQRANRRLQSTEIEYIYKSHQNIFTFMHKLKEEETVESGESGNDLESLRKNTFDESFRVVEFVLNRSQAMMLSSSKMTASSNHIIALLYRSSSILNQLSTTSTNGTPKKHYNIYVDENIPQISICFGLLRDFALRIAELLAEFDSHPLLLQLLQICDRILNFPMSSPLVMVMTGIELLLKKAHEWDQYAAKRYSITEQMRKLFTLIVGWRRIELENWESLFEVRANKFATKAFAQWWFQLYGIINLGSYVKSSEQKEGEGLNEKDSATKYFFEIIDDFIRTANVGQFGSRLSLVLSFYKQIIAEQEANFSRSNVAGNTEIRQQFANILLNTYKYYAQFLPKIQAKIDAHKKPLVDKMREFVKLMRWDDADYHGMKASILKSHRKIAKILRQFELGLVEPARNVWDREDDSEQLAIEKRQEEKAKKEEEKKKKKSAKDQKKDQKKNKKGGKNVKQDAKDTKADGNTEQEEEDDTVDLDLKALRSAFIFARSAQFPAIASSASHSEVLASLFKTQDEKLKQNRLPTLIKKMTTIWSNHISQGPIAKKTDFAFEFAERLSTAIIERSLELQQNKQKLKGLIKQAKAKALRDLLKALEAAGVSYRAKSIDKRLKSIQYVFEQHGLELSIINEDDAHIESELVRVMVKKLWPKSDYYYYKCVHGLQKLRFYYQTHSKDLNAREVEKILGFSENLFLMVLDQRRTIADVTVQQDRLKLVAQSLKDVHECISNSTESKKPKTTISSAILPPHRLMAQWVLAQKTHFDQLQEALEELSLVDASVFKVHQQHLGKNLVSSMNLTEMLRIVSSCKRSVDNRLLGKASAPRATPLLFNARDFEMVERNFNALPELKRLFNEYLSSRTEVLPASDLILNLINDRGMQLYSAFNESVAQFERDAAAASSVPVEKFAQEFHSHVDITIRKILFAIQSLKERNEEAEKLNKGSEVPAKKDDEVDGDQVKADEEDEDNDLAEPDNVFADVREYFNETFKSLALNEVLGSIANTINLVIEFSNAHGRSNGNVSTVDAINVASSILGQLHTLIFYFESLVQSLKFNFLAHHKSLGKLEYILLNLFTLLYKRGFCHSDEEEGKAEDGQGQTSLESGTGMDDGEGARDVSDQIEDDDQLMKAEDLKNNQDKKDHENSDENQGREMDMDFEGELYDVDPKDEDEENDNEQEQDLEEQMGDLEGSKQEVLDEKLWDGEDEDEQDDREQKFEKDNPIDAQTDDNEMRGKEEGEEDNQNQQPQKKKDEKNKPQEKEEFDDEGSDDEGGAIPEFEDKIEDNTGKDVREEEKLDLPEDMKIDEGEEQPEEQQPMEEDEEDKEGEGEGEDKNQDDKTEEFPELKTEEDEGSGEEEKKEETTEEVAEKDDDEKEGGEGDENKEGQDEEGEDEDTRAKGLDNALETEQKKDQEEGEEDEEEQKLEEATAYEKDLKETPFGVQQSAGNQSQMKDQEEQDENQAKEKKVDNTEEGGSDMNNDQMGESWEQRSQKQKPQDQQQPQERQKARFDPNPLRNLGDALKEWKEKIKMVDPKKNEKKEEDDQVGDKDGKEGEAYEYIEDEEDNQEDADQTLGPAEQTQAEAFPELENKDEEEEQKDETMEDAPESAKDTQEGTQEDGKENNDQKRRRNNMRFDNTKLKKDEEDKMDVDDEPIKPEPEEKDFSKLLLEAEKTKENLVQTDFNFERDMIDDSESDDESNPNSNNNDSNQQLPVRLTAEDLKRMREQLDVHMSQWRLSEDKVQHSKELWKDYDLITAPLAQELCEQLRLILEPTLATKLKGDYKTGKRINMKKVIPYIASQFKKDKIWLRRTKPNKRQYQVMVAIDDSESMRENNAGTIACEALTLICKAMAQLEVGELGVVSFGEDTRLLHPFDRPFTDDTGAEILGQFTFRQRKTDLYKFMQHSIQILELSRVASMASTGRSLSGSDQVMQLSFIISDGRLLSDKDAVKRCVREAQEKRQLMVFIVVDNPRQKDSILDMESITFKGGVLQRTRYMDSFPFPYYIVLRDISSMPEVLADALRQWFELMSSMDAE